MDLGLFSNISDLFCYEPDEPDIPQKVSYSPMHFICADVKVTRLTFLSLFNFLFLCISLHFVINPISCCSMLFCCSHYTLLGILIYYQMLECSNLVQGLFVPFACVGSGDPVRVLRLYTTNTLDTLWSIYFWDIYTTCHYRIYVLRAQALWLWDFLLLIHTLLKYLTECTLTLYCVVAYICACVDASRTVFWDCSLEK